MRVDSLSAPEWRAEARYQLHRAEAGAGQTREALQRLRRVLKPGLADAIASMADTDTESAEKRIAWLRDRIEDEAREVA